MHIIGGTYYECILDRNWQQLFGSGFRAAACLGHFGGVRFHTYLAQTITEEFNANAKAFPFAEINAMPFCGNAFGFEYETSVTPPNFYNKGKSGCDAIQVTSEEPILRFGMMEGTAIVHGNKVVYDPQDPKAPKEFGENGSTARQLAIVANHKEVRALFGNAYDQAIKRRLESHRELACVVMKNGPFGAEVFMPEGRTIHIPAYRTRDVVSIGTGDVFSAYFAYFWAERDMAPGDAARYASKAVAKYVSEFGSIQNVDEKVLDSCQLNPVLGMSHLDNPIYLAGPFFTLGDKLLLRKIKQAFQSMDAIVFSPIDDVGVGEPKVVYEGDINGLKKCSAVFANICGLDTGTIYEIGYAQAINKPVSLFAQDCKKKDLTMLEGGGCQIFNDFTSAVYNSIWDAMEYEYAKK